MYENQKPATSTCGLFILFVLCLLGTSSLILALRMYERLHNGDQCSRCTAKVACKVVPDTDGLSKLSVTDLAVAATGSAATGSANHDKKLMK